MNSVPGLGFGDFMAQLPARRTVCASRPERTSLGWQNIYYQLKVGQTFQVTNKNRSSLIKLFYLTQVQN